MTNFNPKYPNAKVHVDAFVDASAKIGFGAFVGAGAFVMNDAFLGDYASVGRDAIINDRARMGESSSVAIGAVLGSEAILADKVCVGPFRKVAAGRLVLHSDEDNFLELPAGISARAYAEAFAELGFFAYKVTQENNVAPEVKKRAQRMNQLCDKWNERAPETIADLIREFADDATVFAKMTGLAIPDIEAALPIGFTPGWHDDDGAPLAITWLAPETEAA